MRRPVSGKRKFVVQAFDESERDLVLRFAIGGDAIPVAINQVDETLVGFEALPVEAGSPIVEEAPRPCLALVIPQLAKGLFEDIGRVETPIGGEQNPG